MTDGLHIDASQIGTLAADLHKIPGLTRRNLRAAITVTARNVKDAWNGKLYTDGHAKLTGHSIDYDVTSFDGFGSTVYEAEVGARSGMGRQAGVVRLLENGKLYTDGHAKLTGHSIDYDVTSFDGFGATVVQAEVGARRGMGRQAGIVRLLENGSVYNAPHGYGAGALHENEADFEHGLDLALHAAEREAGIG